MIENIFFLCLKTVFYGLVIFVSILYVMYFEQKIISFIQMRNLRNTLGLRDFLFPIALLLNLFKVRLVFPETPYKFLYVLAPIVLGFLIFGLGSFIPFHKNGLFINSDYGILWILISSHVGIFFMMLIGWASQTQYSLQGVVRLFGHFISSSLLFVFVSLIVILWSGSMNLMQIIQDQKSMWFIIPLFPVFLLYIIVFLMRGDCVPFGESESDQDLMGGYKSLYDGGLLVLLVVSQYLQFLLFLSLMVVLFFGGWLSLWKNSSMSGFSWFFLKLTVLFFLVSWVKAVMPNFRHDQIIRFSFKILLPFIAILFFFYSFIKIFLGM